MSLEAPAAPAEKTIQIAARAGAATHRTLEAQEEWRSVCGFRRDLVQGREDLGVSFHYIRIFESRKHRHHKATEFCVGMQGRGWMQLGESEVEVKPGDVVVVPPGTWHTYKPDPADPFHLMICVSPGIRPEARDIEFWDETAQGE